MLKLKLFVPSRDKRGLDLPHEFMNAMLKSAIDLVQNLGGTGGTVFGGVGFWFGEDGQVLEKVTVVETFLELDELTPDQFGLITSWAKDTAVIGNQETVMFTIEPTTLTMHFVDAG